MLIIGSISSIYFLPQTPETIASIYKNFVGESFQQLYQFHKKDIDEISQFGIRILGLLAGWFVLLFAFEIVLGVVFGFISFFISTLRYFMFKPKKVI